MDEDEIDTIGILLEEKGLSHSDIDAYFEHAGVKGMKWGVRRQRRANLHNKVGAGKGSRIDKVRAGAKVGPLDLARGKGFRGASRIKGERQTSRNARVKAGEASAKDRLAYIGGSKYQDIFPTGKSATNTKAAVGVSIAGAILVAQGSAIARRALVG